MSKPYNRADDTGTKGVKYFYGFNGDHAREVCPGCRKIIESFGSDGGDDGDGDERIDIFGYKHELPETVYKGIPAYARHMHVIYVSKPETGNDSQTPVEVLSLNRDSSRKEFLKENIHLRLSRTVKCDSRGEWEGCRGCCVHEVLPRPFQIFPRIENWSKASDPTNPFVGLGPETMIVTHRGMLFMDTIYHARDNRMLSSDPAFDAFVN
jgi:hypothetical protein